MGPGDCNTGVQKTLFNLLDDDSIHSGDSQWNYETSMFPYFFLSAYIRMHAYTPTLLNIFCKFVKIDTSLDTFRDIKISAIYLEIYNSRDIFNYIDR